MHTHIPSVLLSCSNFPYLSFVMVAFSHKENTIMLFLLVEFGACRLFSSIFFVFIFLFVFFLFFSLRNRFLFLLLLSFLLHGLSRCALYYITFTLVIFHSIAFLLCVLSYSLYFYVAFLFIFESYWNSFYNLWIPFLFLTFCWCSVTFFLCIYLAFSDFFFNVSHSITVHSFACKVTKTAPFLRWPRFL